MRPEKYNIFQQCFILYILGNSNEALLLFVLEKFLKYYLYLFKCRIVYVYAMYNCKHITMQAHLTKYV